MPRKPEPEPNAVSKALNAEIRAEIARRNLDQKDIAAGMSRGEDYLSRKLADRGSFTTNDLDEICEVLDLDLVELMRRAVSSREVAMAREAERRLRESGRSDESPK